jgi:two-component system chemotaxis sensor kinase CheA
MARDPYRYFRIEARELLDVIERGAVGLAEDGASTPELVDALLRQAHTLKGAARVVKLADMARLAHEVEELLARHRARESAPSEASSEILQLQRQMASLLATLDAPPRPPRDAAKGAESAPAIAVDLEQADAILRTLLEQSTRRAAMHRELEALEQASRLAATLIDQLARGRAREGGDAGAHRALGIAEDLKTLLAKARGALSVGAEQADRGHAELRAAAERLRLAPAGALFASLEGAAHDAASALGKRVELVTTGGDHRLDVGLLAPLRQALGHVVRNAVAHGIEAPEERATAGKSSVGHVELRVERRAMSLAFVCRDDGRGIDLEGIRRAAVERGALAAADAGRLDRDQVLQLAFHAGVSTSRSVSEVSGRGVGLDAVREVARRLQGEVALRTEAGVGTTIEICVPVTLSSLSVLLVDAGGRRVAVPLSAVRRTFRVTPEERSESGGGEVVFDGTAAVPFISIAAALAVGSAEEGARACSALAIEAGPGRVAVGVDRLLGVESVLVRPLPPLTPSSPLVNGVFLDAAGAPHLVLDPAGLVARARSGATSRPHPDRAARPPVLVIDDSLTTRMLEQSILESAGYEVEVATSAEEALAKAGERRYGLFVVDVEMPGMDGFEFVARTRADPVLRHTPAIMVSSRGSAEDRQRGKEAGAHAYIVKSEFDQAHLLRTIRELVE